MNIATEPMIGNRETDVALHRHIMEQVDAESAVTMAPEDLEQLVGSIVEEGAKSHDLYLNRHEQRELIREIVDDMVRLGPLQPLMDDPTVNDILVNGPKSVYVERKGRLELTGRRFRDQSHLTNLAQRIASAVGRRIDESSPMVDARLPDGSRVNVITSPLSLGGTCISIRKFSRVTYELEDLVAFGSMSKQMAEFLKLATAARLNIIVSGGTGSGKTTLLNAVSRHIGEEERVVTIEDAAELRLQQHHVVRLETRPPSLEGKGEVTQRDLLRNALRMRPDRILLGEVRGAEAFDMLQAMNTGHDGSLSTVHANSPSDAMLRLENMLNMGAMNMSSGMIRRQLGSAIDLLVQIERSVDGVRRVTNISEIFCRDGDVQCADVYEYRRESESIAAYTRTAHIPSFGMKFIAAGKWQRCQEVLGYAG